MINIVLLEPEIPNNTGNIVRTCAATGAHLHVIEPCGFSWEDKYLKRSGLDYWDLADVKRYPNMQAFIKENFGDNNIAESGTASVAKQALEGEEQILFASTKASICHSEVKYDKDCYVFFGRETRGLPEKLLEKVYDKCVRIPMRKETRSLNLANSVAIIIYEYLRQFNYEGMKEDGQLTGRDEQEY